MSKDPAFLFYSSDFLTGTILMSNEQIGIYVKLLCIQHQHGGMIDKASFNAIVLGFDLVRIKFIEVEEGFFNKRLMEEMVKRQKKSESLSANAKIRWAKEKEKQCKSNAIASDLHMPIEDEDVNVNRDIRTKELFNNIWDKYPVKDGKKRAWASFKASVKTEEEYKQIEKALNNYLNSENVKKGFIKNGSTWFANWSDWIDYTGVKKQASKPIKRHDDFDPKQMEQWKKESEANPVQGKLADLTKGIGN